MNPPAIDPKRLLPLLVLTAMVGPSALNMPLPAVPGLAVELGSDVATVQLVITLFLFGFATSQLILGPLSDRFGRRPVLIAGLTLAVVTGLVAAYASSIGWLLLARSLQSLGASSGVVLGRAIIRDLYERDRAASMMGWVTMAMAAAPMVSPAIGGLLTETVGWRWIFVFSSVLAGLALVGAFLWLPETRPQNISVSARSIARDGWALIRDPGFIGYTGVAAFFNCTFFTFVGGAPHVVVTVMGLSAKTYGLWFALIAFGYMVGNAISGRYSQRFGIDRMLRFGVLLGLAGAILQFALMALNMINTPFGLFLPQAIIAVGNGLVLPSAYAGAVSVNPRIAGSASGLTGSVQMLLAAIMSQFSGMAVGYTLSGSPMIIMIFVEAILALLTYLYLRRYLASVAAA